jgi:murein DD-endopeptidase MepM/ murein hydrolase activator NlpD
MNLIFVARRDGKARHLHLTHPLTLAVFVCAVLLVFGAVFWVGSRVGASRADQQWTARLAPDFDKQQQEVVAAKSALQDRVDALSLRIGTLNAHLVRLNALGKRLAQMANINSKEFDFETDPPQGGPEERGSEHDGRTADVSILDSGVSNLQRVIDFRGAQLSALENVLLGKQLSADTLPTGRPVAEGYVSSGYGERMDPFNGEEAFHKGIDFAASAGATVLSVAAGVVTWSGVREGFGNLVEIAHGNGLVTRYAHNSRTLVSVGDKVDRGQAIAVVGSTGRSTGPHVHFEVLKNSIAVNPASYIGR